MVLGAIGFAIPIFGPIVFTIRCCMAWLKMPTVEFHPPQNGASEPHLTWWHVPVSLKYKFLKPFPLQDLSVDLTLETPISRTLQLCWRSDEGPTRRITLFDGEIRYIPIVARTTAASFMLATRAGMVIPPGSLADWVMRRDIPRIVDVQHYFVFNGVTDLEAPSEYRTTLKLFVGNRLVGKKSYLISVPDASSPNENDFRLVAVS